MAEAYQKFLAYDWSDERWQSYLLDLYPTPGHKQIIKFKKKWYKKNVDTSFDEKYEPESSDSSSSWSRGSTRPSAQHSHTYGDEHLWAIMKHKAALCFMAYAIALTLVVGAVVNIFSTQQALLMLVLAFVLEILVKYGFKFKKEYLQSVLLDDVGVMPIMSFTLLTPGMHPTLRMFGLVPSALTALLSISHICKGCTSIPNFIRNSVLPLAQVQARYQIMQVRANVEVTLGFVLVGSIFMFHTSPVSVILYWNFMMMRYMTSSWTQATFRKVDGTLQPICGKIPGIRSIYSALKRVLYSFVDPTAKRSGSMCTIL